MLVREYKLDKAGFAYVPIDIRPKDALTMRSIDYKVDSGANRTTISAMELLKLGFDEDWIKSSGRLLSGNARPTLASGLPVDGCYLITLPEIRIVDWVGYNWPFMTSLSLPFRFLLGTDSMQFFNWNFDYENGVYRFSLIPGRRKLLFNELGQSIHAINENH